MENESHFNLMSAETLPQSGYYFSSQNGKVKSCVFHSLKEGYEVLLKFSEENEFNAETLLYLLRKLMKSKLPIFTISEEDFYLNMENFNAFLILVAGEYQRLEGLMIFCNNNYQPFIQENEYSCPLKADLFFLPKIAFSENGKIVPVVKEFNSKEKFFNWLSSDEAHLNLSNAEINRLSLQVSSLRIDEFSDEEIADLNFVPIVFGQTFCLN